jgi:hypothetical protein
LSKGNEIKDAYSAENQNCLTKSLKYNYFRQRPGSLKVWKFDDVRTVVFKKLHFTESMMCLRFANDGMVVFGEVGGVFGPHHMDHFLKSKKILS